MHAWLRAEILAGRLAPGQRLSPGELAAQHGVSSNVVREALSRLAGERLVSSAPQQGFAVVSVSAPDLEHVTELRELVELHAIRRSIERGGLDWEGAVVAAHHRLAHTPMTSSEHPRQLDQEWARAHLTFHAATMSGCQNPRLAELATRLNESAEIYRYRSQMADQGSRDVAAEHRAIFEAVIARDAPRACQLHAEHIRCTARIAVGRLPGPDGDDRHPDHRIGPGA